MSLTSILGWILLTVAVAGAFVLRRRAAAPDDVPSTPVSQSNEIADAARWCDVLESIAGGEVFLVDASLRICAAGMRGEVRGMTRGRHLIDLVVGDAASPAIACVRRAQRDGSASWTGAVEGGTVQVRAAALDGGVVFVRWCREGRP